MRSRRNNTTMTRKVDKWNPRKVWLIKRYADGLGLRPACYLDSDLLISVEDGEATDDVTPEHAGEIIAALAEQFGGTFATEDQLTTALSFMLGTLRATREKEARHE